MAIDSLTTSSRTLKTALSVPSHFSCSAMQLAFCDLLKSLAQLLRIEELLASNWSFDPAFDLDPVEVTHAYAAVRAKAQKLRDLTPTSRGDKALKLTALLVHIAIDVEEGVDRNDLHQMVAHARTCLLISADDPEAAIVNALLDLVLSHLNRLDALEGGDMLLQPCDGCESCDAENDPVFCA